jgi:glutathione peroxidase
MRPLYVLAAASLLAVGASAEDAATDGVTNAHDFTFHAQATALYQADGQPWNGPSFEEGQEVKLSDYAGHPILVVNTAAKCGFTPQFEGLQAVWDEYRDEGLVVIGVHANNFAEQGGSEAELAEQCGVYAVDFPQMQMVDVIGPSSDPFYAWVRSTMTAEQLRDAQRPDRRDAMTDEELRASGFPGWNFNKVLIDAEGNIAGTYLSGDFTDRASVQPELVEAIEAELARS